MKYLSGLIVTIGILCSIQGLALAAGFTDTNGHWAKQYIERIAEEGIVQGKTPSHYAPDDNVSRAELLKMALNAFNIAVDSEVTEDVLSDVVRGDWFAPYVRAAFKNKIIYGFNNGFGPNTSATRGMAVTILTKAAGYSDVESHFSENYTTIEGLKTANFSDVPLDAYYAPYIAYLYDMQVIDGYEDGSFGPGNPITRAEIAKIVANMIGGEASVEESEPESIVAESETLAPAVDDESADDSESEIKDFLKEISLIKKLEDYYPYLTNAKLNEIKNLVTMIYLEEDKDFPDFNASVMTTFKSLIRSKYLPGDFTSALLEIIENDNSYRKVVASQTIDDITFAACLGLQKSDDSWKIDCFDTGTAELLQDKCNGPRASVELLDGSDLVASQISYSSEYQYQVYLNNYLIDSGVLNGGVKSMNLPILKGDNELKIVMGESGKSYIDMDDPWMELAEEINGLEFKIVSDGKTLVDFSTDEGGRVETIEFTY